MSFYPESTYLGLRIAIKDGSLSYAEIARKFEVSVGMVANQARLLEEERRAAEAAGKTCKRPDVDNDLKPCGRPRHRLPCGALLGVCKMHWEKGKPLPGGKMHARGGGKIV